MVSGPADRVWIRKTSLALGYDQDAFERAYRLAHLLREMGEDRWLAPRLALKGGTCINFFHADLPRLSVDLDLNYVGSLDRERMREERPRVEKEIGALAEEFGYRVTVQRASYIMWRARLEYENSRGNPDNIKADVNYLMRVPLYGVEHLDLPRVFDLDPAKVPCLAVDDVFGGKLKALAARGEPRDLFDAAHLFNGNVAHDPRRLRKAFLFYAHMDDATLGSIDLTHARALTEKAYGERLYPVLRDGNRPRPEELANLVIPLVEAMLDMDADERSFGELLLAHAYEPELLFSGVEVSADIRRHPAGERRRLHPRRTTEELDE